MTEAFISCWMLHVKMNKTTSLFETAAVTDDGHAKCSKKKNLTGGIFPTLTF